MKISENINLNLECITGIATIGGGITYRTDNIRLFKLTLGKPGIRILKDKNGELISITRIHKADKKAGLTKSRLVIQKNK
jgi:hypothetical protein